MRQDADSYPLSFTRDRAIITSDYSGHREGALDAVVTVCIVVGKGFKPQVSWSRTPRTLRCDLHFFRLTVLVILRATRHNATRSSLPMPVIVVPSEGLLYYPIRRIIL